MHDGLDCPLPDWHHVRQRLRGLHRQPLAFTSDADSRHHLRGCHGPGAILHPATIIWAWNPACKAPNPTQARLRSLMNHTAFGVGLYLFAVLGNGLLWALA